MRVLALFALPLVLLLAALAPEGASAATLQISPTGSDSNPCTSAAPCLSMNRAYSVAQPGDVVKVAGGSYPSQVINAPSKSAGPNVVFEPVSGATPTIGALRIEGSAYITARNLKVNRGIVRIINTSSTTSGARAHHINLDGLTGAIKLMITGYVTDINVKNWESGDTTDNQPQIIKYDQSYADNVAPQRITIEDSYFHDYRASPGAHTECLQILNGIDIMIRRNKFTRCQGTGNIGVTNGPITNLTIENNWIGQGSYGAQITKNTRNLVFRNNSAVTSVFFSDTDNGGPYTFTGNYMPFHSSICGEPDATSSYNVMRGGACSSTDRNVSSLKFVDAAGFDLHLAAGSEAIDHVKSGFPATDIDGQARPVGAGADAGADEVSSQSPAPNPGPDPNPNPQPAPTANASFTVNPASPRVGQEVTFDASGSTCKAPCTYTWEDDGPDGPGGSQWSLGSGAVLKRTFTDAGDPTKYVRVTVRGADGGEHSVMKPVTVAPADTTTPAPAPLPNASFTVNPANPRVGQEVTFDGSGSTCKAPCTYTWSDDGPDGPGGTNWSLGTGAVLKRTFTDAGDPTKYVRLTIKDADGVEHSVMKPVQVAPAQTTADFTVNPANPRVGQEVTFDASSAYCVGGCTSYTWVDDGPDGPGGAQWSLGTGAVLKRTFTAAGDPTKYVRLTVRAADGSTHTVMKPVYVAP